ncbi:hypothetical protein VTK73DRAFT_7513 [Phialemonium thermophilum]|uniref:Uncharacterized protein n=1 Tax=Phialemonium thermophilum TaxID=223376 RepID=A0ABR3WEB0_9PEZI
MKDEWDPEPQCYLAVAAPKFPNYFIVNGPRGNWGLGSALNSHEVQVEYMLKFMKRMQEEQVKSFTVKKETVAELYEHIEAWHHRAVWDADCKSWYKNNIVGGKIWLWGGSNLHYIKTIREPKYEHFDFKYLHKNPIAYLGNGFVEAEVTYYTGDNFEHAKTYSKSRRLCVVSARSMEHINLFDDMKQHAKFMYALQWLQSFPGWRRYQQNHKRIAKFIGSL